MSSKTDIVNAFKNKAIEAKREFNKNSFTYSLDDSIGKIEDIAFQSKAFIKDRYSNELTSTGTSDKVQSFTNYGFSNDTLNWSLWLSLYNDSWVFRRAIDKPAQDIISCGFSIQGDEDYTSVYKLYETYKSKLTELLMWGALFGGSIAVMMFDCIDDSEMQNPIPKDRIKGAHMKLYVTDRWYGVSEANQETVSNMKDIDFGQPKMYNITFADGKTIKVHHHYVLRYEHRCAPQLIKRGHLQGWGYSEGCHILNELSRDDQIKSAITSLVNKALIEVIKMKGMRGIFMGSDKENQDQLMKRLEMVNWARSFNSLTFLDKDDDYNMQGFQGLGSLAELLNTNMKLVGAALEMPGVLFGDLDGGFSADTVAIQRYSITIKNRADTYFRPVLHKFLKILFLMTDTKGAISFSFNSLTQIDDNNKRIESIEKMTSSLNNLCNSKVISTYQVALSLKDFVQKGVINIQFTNERLAMLKIEEETEILANYKKLGKNPEQNNNQLGNDMSFNNESSFNEPMDLGNDISSNEEPSSFEENPPSDLGNE